MADQGQLERLWISIQENNGCSAWNAWRKAGENRSESERFHKIDLSRASLSNANLSGVDLHDANLRGANLSVADLSNADLSRADLKHADLSGTNFSHANLIGANLSSANLRFASLLSADLSETDLSGAHLYAVDLANANLSRSVCVTTIFAYLDLRTVQGIDTIDHRGPSSLDIESLYQSQGQIPDEFLRGCGISDDMISHIHSLAGAIQYYAVFISYNHRDNELATRLYNDLQAVGVRCWKYSEDIGVGDHILATVDEIIRIYDKMLVILSESSIASPWITSEITLAFAKEQRTGIKVIYPIRSDDAVITATLPWSDHIRSRNIVDFTHWRDHDMYQIAFQKLLQDLRISDASL